MEEIDILKAEAKEIRGKIDSLIGELHTIKNKNLYRLEERVKKLEEGWQ